MSDGGSDENPRYKKVIMCSCHNFKHYDVDAIFIITKEYAGQTLAEVWNNKVIDVSCAEYVCEDCVIEQPAEV